MCCLRVYEHTMKILLYFQLTVRMFFDFRVLIPLDLLQKEMVSLNINFFSVCLVWSPHPAPFEQISPSDAGP